MQVAALVRAACTILVPVPVATISSSHRDIMIVMAQLTKPEAQALAQANCHRRGVSHRHGKYSPRLQLKSSESR